MIAYLDGLLAAATPSYLIIDVGGVGYKVSISTATFSKLPDLKNRCRIWTAHVMREYAQTLYGFLQEQESSLFETLIGVNGVGPKMALNILGHFSSAELLMALDAGDTAALSKVPGVGKKTAQRLLVDLRDKVDMPQGSVQNSLEKTAISALINLGYSETVAKKAVKKSLEFGEHTDAATLITASLKEV